MSGDYLAAQARKFIADCDREAGCLKGIDWSVKADDLLVAVAAACRQGIVRVPIAPPPQSSGENRFRRPGESAEDMIRRCAAGTWRSVGREFEFPGGIDYHCSPDPTLNTVGLPYGEWTWQLNRHHEWQTAAQLYHATRDGFHSQAVAGWLRSWLEQCPCPSEDLNARQGPWRTIEIGIRLGSVWPQVLSALANAPECEDVLFLAWLQSYAEQARFVYQHRKRNNWLLMEMNGLMHASVQICMHREAASWRRQATEVLIAETKEQFHPDGMQRELSTSYHLVCFHNYQRAVQILRQTGAPVDPRLDLCLKNMLKPLRALAAGDGRLFNFQDSNAGSLRQVLLSVPADWLIDGDQWFLGRGGAPPAIRHHHLENSGFVVLRSGYTDKDIAVAFDGGPFGDGHQHEDKLSFQLHAGGTMLLGDGGMVDYNDSPERRYSLSTLAHNTAIIDGMGQNRRRGYSDRRFPIEGIADLACDLSAEQAWVRADYDEGYGEDQMRGVRHRRTLTLLGGHAVEVRDEFLVRDDREHRVEILFHLMTNDAGVKAETCQCRKNSVGMTLRWRCEEGAVDPELHAGGMEPDLRGWSEPDSQRPGLREVAPLPCLTLSALARHTLTVITTIRVSFETQVVG